MSGERKRSRELRKLVESMGGSAQDISRGRHSHNLLVTRPDGSQFVVPVAGSTGRGRARHLSNAAALLKRLIRGDQPKEATK